jgi:hypothetical protein
MESDWDSAGRQVAYRRWLHGMERDSVRIHLLQSRADEQLGAPSKREEILAWLPEERERHEAFIDLTYASGYVPPQELVQLQDVVDAEDMGRRYLHSIASGWYATNQTPHQSRSRLLRRQGYTLVELHVELGIEQSLPYGIEAGYIRLDPMPGRLVVELASVMRLSRDEALGVLKAFDARMTPNTTPFADAVLASSMSDECKRWWLAREVDDIE